MNKVINFGCRLNNFEGKKIEELLPKKDESIVVINSCAVTNETERQVRQTIRKIKKQNPNSKLILTGCAAQISPSKYNQMEEVDYLVDNINKLKPETWKNDFKVKKNTFKIDNGNKMKLFNLGVSIIRMLYNLSSRYLRPLTSLEIDIS